MPSQPEQLTEAHFMELLELIYKYGGNPEWTWDPVNGWINWIERRKNMDPVHDPERRMACCDPCCPPEQMHLPGIEEQPMPQGNGPEVAPLVVQDLLGRVEVGRNRYGTKLRAFNGRSALLDLYQELLDAVLYARQLLLEIDMPRCDPEAGSDRAE